MNEQSEEQYDNCYDQGLYCLPFHLHYSLGTLLLTEQNRTKDFINVEYNNMLTKALLLCDKNTLLNF